MEERRPGIGKLDSLLLLSSSLSFRSDFLLLFLLFFCNLGVDDDDDEAVKGKEKLEKEGVVDTRRLLFFPRSFVSKAFSSCLSFLPSFLSIHR